MKSRREITFSVTTNVNVFECLVIAGGPELGYLNPASFRDTAALHAILRLLRDMWIKEDTLYVPEADLMGLHNMECKSAGTHVINIPQNIAVEPKKMARYYVYLLFRYCISAMENGSLWEMSRKAPALMLMDIPSDWMLNAVATKVPPVFFGHQQVPNPHQKSRREITFSNTTNVNLFECLVIAGTPAIGFLHPASFRDTGGLQAILCQLRDMWTKVDTLYVPETDLMGLHGMECKSAGSHGINIPQNITGDPKKLTRYYVYLLFHYCVSAMENGSSTKTCSLMLMDIPWNRMHNAAATNYPCAPPVFTGDQHVPIQQQPQRYEPDSVIQQEPRPFYPGAQHHAPQVNEAPQTHMFEQQSDTRHLYPPIHRYTQQHQQPPQQLQPPHQQQQLHHTQQQPLQQQPLHQQQQPLHQQQLRPTQQSPQHKKPPPQQQQQHPHRPQQHHQIHRQQTHSLYPKLPTVQPQADKRAQIPKRRMMGPYCSSAESEDDE